MGLNPIHGTISWRIGLLGEGRHPLKVEKWVRNPYALPIMGSCGKAHRMSNAKALLLSTNSTHVVLQDCPSRLVVMNTEV